MHKLSLAFSLKAPRSTCACTHPNTPVVISTASTEWRDDATDSAGSETEKPKKKKVSVAIDFDSVLFCTAEEWGLSGLYALLEIAVCILQWWGGSVRKKNSIWLLKSQVWWDEYCVCKSNVVAVGNDPDPTFLYVLVVIRVICCCSQNDQSWCVYALKYITMWQFLHLRLPPLPTCVVCQVFSVCVRLLLWCICIGMAIQSFFPNLSTLFVLLPKKHLLS